MELKNNRGVTGVDVAIAVVVLTVFVAFVASLFYNTGNTAKKIERKSEATNLAIEVIEGMKVVGARNFSDLPPGEDTLTIDKINELNSSSITVPNGYTVKIGINEDDKYNKYNEDNVVKILKVEVEYLSGKGTEKVIIETLVKNGELLDDNVESGELTIGKVYKEDMIGTVIKNTTLDEKLPEGTEWIILGKDKDGSIMLTTSKPIANGFTVKCTAEAWLYYEDGEGEKEQYNINKACSKYGGTIQGKEIKSRSITLEDVNRVTGFVEPTFNTYTFTNEATDDYANKKLNYWHPDINGTASSSDGEGDPNFWSKNETTYKCNGYWYSLDESSNTVKYEFEGTNWKEVEYVGTLKNTNIIFGDSSDYCYLLASRSVSIINDYGLAAYFRLAYIDIGSVHSNVNSLVSSNSDSFYDNDQSYTMPVRPIINLPSDIEIKQVSGEWTIID